MISLKDKPKLGYKKAYILVVILIFIKAFLEQALSLLNGYFRDIFLLLLWCVPIYCSYILAMNKGFLRGVGLIFYIVICAVLFLFVFDINTDFTNAKTMLSFKIYVVIHFFLCLIGSFSAWVYAKF